jgi:flavin-dependent dehydrogenase
MRVAINGCGVAGPTLAWWLRHYGHEPVLLERATSPRTGGYLIDFWGTGYDVAERMGLLPALKQRAYKMQRLRSVNAHGWPTSTIDATVFDEITDGRYFSIARSELSAEILKSCAGIEMRFGTGIVGIEDRGTELETALADGSRGASILSSAPMACTRKFAASPSARNPHSSGAWGSTSRPSHWADTSRATNWPRSRTRCRGATLRGSRFAKIARCS